MSEDYPTPEELAATEAKAAAFKAAQDKADETNKTRSGKGTRIKVATTRGRNSQIISFEQFDESQPSTLPTSLGDFMDLTKVSDEKTIVGFLIDGYNSMLSTAASDPVEQFVEATWTDDFKRSFKMIVKQYAVNNGISVEDAVALIKPVLAVGAAKA